MSHPIDPDIAALRAIVGSAGPYTFLSIGSNLGCGLESVFPDPLCQIIHAVDLRVASCPDERGKACTYGVTTAGMIKYLSEQEGTKNHMHKLRTYDMDSAGFVKTVECHPEIVFLDAEHTNAAVFQDFLNVFPTLPPNSIFAFHDAIIVFDALVNIQAMLTFMKIRFKAVYLPGVFALGFGEFADPVGALPTPLDPVSFLQNARKFLNAEIARNTPL
jgi:hypothetical protein